jgi:hypothetical protein
MKLMGFHVEFLLSLTQIRGKGKNAALVSCEDAKLGSTFDLSMRGRLLLFRIKVNVLN